MLIRKSIKNLLNSMNLKSEEAEDGLEAINLIVERYECKNCTKFKLVFMDIMMPNMDGYQACSELMDYFDNFSTSDNIEKPKIIISSAHDVESIRLSFSKNYLVKSFVPKPLNKSKLQSSLKENYERI